MTELFTLFSKASVWIKQRNTLFLYIYNSLDIILLKIIWINVWHNTTEQADKQEGNAGICNLLSSA